MNWNRSKERSFSQTLIFGFRVSYLSNGWLNTVQVFGSYFYNWTLNDLRFKLVTKSLFYQITLIFLQLWKAPRFSKKIIIFVTFLKFFCGHPSQHSIEKIPKQVFTWLIIKLKFNFPSFKQEWKSKNTSISAITFKNSIKLIIKIRLQVPKKTKKFHPYLITQKK